MNELFSIIIICYNNSHYLMECIDSVLSQDYPNIEIIIADDGSKVFEAERYENYCRENAGANIKRVLVYSNEKNLGTVKNCNTAISKAEGELLKVIACDDCLSDSASLSNAARNLRSSSDGIITGDVIKCDAEMKEIGMYPNRFQRRLNDMSPEEIFARLCIHNDIIAGGVFYTKSFFEKYGPYDECYRLLEDWPTWLRVSKEGGKIVYTPFNAVRYRSNGGIGTGMNPLYLADKKRVLDTVIKENKKRLGTIGYLKAIVSYRIINSPFIRKTYAFIFRKGEG